MIDQLQQTMFWNVIMKYINTALLLPSMDINGHKHDSRLVTLCIMLYNLCNNTSFTYTMTILICKHLYLYTSIIAMITLYRIIYFKGRLASKLASKQYRYDYDYDYDYTTGPDRCYSDIVRP